MAVAKNLFVDRLNHLFGMAKVSVGRGDQCFGFDHCCVMGERVFAFVPHPVGGLSNEIQYQRPSYITSVMETILPPRAWMYFIWLDMSLPDTK